MGAMRVVGRESGSVLGNPRVLLAPRAPYRPAAGAPYRAGGAGILELPIAVTGLARLPVIGTSLILAPAWLRARMVAAALRAPLFNLELHGIDLCDADRPTTSPPRWSPASPICAARSPTSSPPSTRRCPSPAPPAPASRRSPTPRRPSDRADPSPSPLPASRGEGT